MDNERLRQQIAFIIEIDKLKDILRRTYVLSGGRLENSAEHSWQLALMAMLLSEHSNEPIDVCHVVKMVIVHDLVEIDAGDTYCYDAVAEQDKVEREERAAERIFGMLPADQNREIRLLWEEFEARETPEARFATAIDRLMPMLLNYYTQGKSWKEHGIKQSQARARNAHIVDGSSPLWEAAQELIEKAVAQGYLTPA